MIIVSYPILIWLFISDVFVLAIMKERTSLFEIYRFFFSTVVMYCVIEYISKYVSFTNLVWNFDMLSVIALIPSL